MTMKRMWMTLLKLRWKLLTTETISPLHHRVRSFVSSGTETFLRIFVTLYSGLINVQSDCDCGYHPASRRNFETESLQFDPQMSLKDFHV